jgi:hypothetical protein
MVCYLGWVFVSRYVSTLRWSEQQRLTATPAPNTEFDRTYGGSALRILNFYARDGNMTEGESTLLCYGVVNARAVRIEPPVEGVYPAISRCISIAPEGETRYRLVAEGRDGQTAEASFVLPVRPDYASFPRITAFRIAGQQAQNGRPVYSLYFGAQNAEDISIDPPVFGTLHRAAYGRFFVSPDRTTTYTLTVTGKKGRRSQRQLTIEVP